MLAAEMRELALSILLNATVQEQEPQRQLPFTLQ